MSKQKPDEKLGTAGIPAGTRTETLGAVDGPAAGEADAGLPAKSGERFDPRKLALNPALQSLWKNIFPLIGVLPARPGEYPGIVKVEPGLEAGEATVHIELPEKPYQPGKPSDMNRVVTLSVKLAHDHRRLGGRYYCIDCDIPENETRH